MWKIMRADILELLLPFSGRKHKKTPKHTHTDWIHTSTRFSSFWADFQCAICSAEETTNVFWKLALMTMWSVPFSNYRRQHTCTKTHIGQTNTLAKLNIDVLFHTLRSFSQTQKHVDWSGKGLKGRNHLKIRFQLSFNHGRTLVLTQTTLLHRMVMFWARVLELKCVKTFCESYMHAPPVSLFSEKDKKNIQQDWVLLGQNTHQFRTKMWLEKCWASNDDWVCIIWH